jgi:RNA polymerase sigma-70 factor, ECF subfamily
MRPSRRDLAEMAVGLLSTLYNTAYRLTGNQPDAEDLVQETYAQALAHLHELRSPAKCKAWMFRILRNQFVSNARARRARPELTVLDGGAMEGAVLEPDRYPDRAALVRLSGRAIAQALAELSEELRTSVLLAEVEGFSYQEIAHVMECPIGTVRSRIARARMQLIGALAPAADAFGIGKERRP